MTTMSEENIGMDKWLDDYNVIWTSPSADENGSMPIGNGEVGLNVWVEPNGDLLIYLARTDSWDENERLCKVGRVRISCTPSLVPGDFQQTLKLKEGEIVIVGGPMDAPITIRVWPDANHPVARVEVESEQKIKIRVALELWRNAERTLLEKNGSGVDECHGVYGFSGPKISYPDTVLTGRRDRIVWYHRNPVSPWKSTLERQQLGSAIVTETDPLLHRVFGGLIRGHGLVNDGDRALVSAEAAHHFHVSIYTHTTVPATEAEFVGTIERNVATLERLDLAQAQAAHRSWWAAFWNRSWIRATGTAAAESVTRGYILQRFISASAGRGAFPIKFNGSLFNVSTPFDADGLQHFGDANYVPQQETRFDPDFRRWGGGYWFQNTRLVYWPMLASGDFDMMLPFFRLFANLLPVCKVRSHIYFQHEGAFFPETMSFYGAYINGSFGYAWEAKPTAEKPFDWKDICTFISRHCNGMLELIALMLDYHSYTKDEHFLQLDLLPMADAFLAWWDHHWPRDAAGKMVMFPSSALETYWEARNPAQDIAGLAWDLDALLALQPAQIGVDRRARWQRLRAALAALPLMDRGGRHVLAPAELPLPDRTNFENPDLYAVFPFRLFGVGKPDLQLAIDTFQTRLQRGHAGWFQDETQAAFLGLTNEARDGITDRANHKHAKSRFPAFWGPNFDWVPDQDHGGNLLMALQTMLLQADNGKIHLLPAWPAEWDVEFRLHAPGNTVVEGTAHGGKIVGLKVTPESRMQDVVPS